MSRFVVVVVTLISLAAINYEIVKKETILTTGESLYINLAPVDPRSLIQGDYMTLRYRLPRHLVRSKKGIARKGYLLGEINEKGVFIIKSVYQKENKLKPNQRRILYRFRNGGIQVGSNAYYFQEGHAKYYDNARYGELRLSKSGNTVLVALRDKDLKLLGPDNDRAHTAK